MKRTAMNRGKGFAPHVFPLPSKTCTVCEHLFTPGRMAQHVCGQRCAMKVVTAKKKAEKQAEQALTRSRKEAIKSIADLIAEAQTAFNAYIRARDAGQPCICCGKPFEPQKPGGSMDAGHWRSRGAAPQLRFNEDNCHGQRKNCNRPGGAKAGPFREGMLARIGAERVAALENNNAAHHWTREELRDIRATYKQKLKELKERSE